MAVSFGGFWTADLEGTVARMNQCLIGWGTAAEIGALNAATYAGCALFATDTQQVYYSNGSAWAVMAPGLNVAETINGVKTFGSIPVLPASDPTTDNQAVRKSYADAQKRQAAAGGALCASNDTESFTNETSYTLVKTIYLCDRGGTYRIKFDLKNTNGAGTTYGKIYRNGGAVGTERTKADNAYTTYSEDIAGWAAGDSVQLYCYGNVASGPRCDFRNLRVYASVREVSSST